MKFLLFLFSELLIACSNPALAQCNSKYMSSPSTITNCFATTISSFLPGISGLISSLGLVTDCIPSKCWTSIQVINIYLMWFLAQNYSSIEYRSVALQSTLALIGPLITGVLTSVQIIIAVASKTVSSVFSLVIHSPVFIRTSAHNQHFGQPNICSSGSNTIGWTPRLKIN